MDFIKVKQAVNLQLAIMESSGVLLETDVDKDELWDLYLDSFPEGTNPMFRERTEHDCSCCKQFIRSIGHVVSIVDGNIITPWDVELDGPYGVVCGFLSDLVRGSNIKGRYYHYQANIGTNSNKETTENGVLTWSHFHYKLSSANVLAGKDIDTAVGKHRTAVSTFKRALDEITKDAVGTVIELIEQNSILRGTEKLETVKEFSRHLDKYNKLDTDQQRMYVWIKEVHGSISGIRGSSIGTLLVDLSNQVDLTKAVKKYEDKVSGTNYKRPSALITSGMIDKAKNKVDELGIGESLHRRYAHADDLDISDVLFANRDAKKSMGVFDEMKSEVGENMQNFDKVEEVGIDAFIADILPTASSVELMFENKHSSNLVSLIAPLYSDAPSITKWGNNFSWTYNGDIADSMKDRVRDKGGNVDGVLRFSIQWNDGDDNQNDFDAHCLEPNGNLIYYSNKARRHPSSGMLDVDIIDPGKDIAVENIIYTDINKMPHGKYQFMVHNYSHNGGRTGFTAEIEYDGIIHHYAYNKNIPNRAKVQVAEVGLGGLGFSINHMIDSEEMSKEYWNINTQNWQNVSMVMHSPNHWHGERNGNKHWFFMLTDCKHDGKARGFYNEFLKSELDEHRKVFEVLGSKMKTEESDNQLSGLGFSSTQRNSVLCKVTGSFNRVVKINF